MRSAALAVRIPPALAGGRLREFHRTLWVASRSAQEARAGLIVIDPSLASAEDLDLWLLDAQGNPCRLPGPESGVLTEHGRSSLLVAARDRMPGTSKSEPALQRLLPRPGDTPLEASLELWRDLFAAVPHIEVLAAANLPPGAEEVCLGEVPEVVLVSSRHRQAMRELGVPIEVVLAGEAALKDELAQRDVGDVRRLSNRMGVELETNLAALHTAILRESPGMLGSWNRYRRAGRKAAAEFRRASERFERNRKGIRGSRLHALAQGLCPHGLPQQDHIGLVCAIALFHLEPALTAVEHKTVFHGAAEQAPHIVNIGAGISAP
ncbi:MAG: hypothetical protein MK209_03760 [Planctomycetes bacterium]|nr:hypothetical protein [Planctomycetota bacterium]